MPIQTHSCPGYYGSHTGEAYAGTVAVTSAQITAFLMLNAIGSLKLKVRCRTTIPIFAGIPPRPNLKDDGYSNCFFDASNYRNREAQHPADVTKKWYGKFTWHRKDEAR